MAKFFNPDGMAPPQAAYHHGVLVPTGTQTLYIAGQLGVDADGKLGDGIEEQARWAFRNLATVLESAGMGPENLVKIQMFLTEVDFRQPAHIGRAEALGDVQPASTQPTVPQMRTLPNCSSGFDRCRNVSELASGMVGK